MAFTLSVSSYGTATAFAATPENAPDTETVTESTSPEKEEPASVEENTETDMPETENEDTESVSVTEETTESTTETDSTADKQEEAVEEEDNEAPVIGAGTFIDLGETPVDLYFITSGYSISLPDSMQQTYQISIPEAEGKKITYTKSGTVVNVSQDGYVEVSGTKWYRSGTISTTAPPSPDAVPDSITYKEGTAVITAQWDGGKATFRFNVQDYLRIYKDSKEDEIIASVISASMTDLEKLKAVTKYIADNYDYSTAYSSAIRLLTEGKGDCWASSNLIIELCAKLGINARLRDASNDTGAASNHKNVLAVIDGRNYIADAGYTGNKPRQWSVTEDNDGFCITSKGVLTLYEGSAPVVNIPDTVTSIGGKTGNVFYSMARDTTQVINIPASVTEISPYAFAGLKALEAINVDSGNPVYMSDGNAIYSKDGTTLYFVMNREGSFTIPPQVKTIAPYAFYTCDSITDVSIGAGVTTIGEGAFGGCSSLASIEIPKTVSYIGKNSFYDTTAAITILNKSAEIVYPITNRAKCTITGYAGSTAEAYAAQKKHTFTVLEDVEIRDIANAAVSDIPEQEYTGKAVEPAFTVKYGDDVLYEGVDYTVSYQGNTDPGTASVTLTGIGDYTGSKTVRFTIIYKDNPDLHVTVDKIPNKTYTGKALKPRVTVRYDGNAVASDMYKVTYKNNVNAGTATVTVKPTAKASWTKTFTMTFKINKAVLKNVTVSGAFDTEAWTSVITVAGVPNGIPYTLQYKSKNTTLYSKKVPTVPGTYDVKITAPESANYKAYEGVFEVYAGPVDISKAEITLSQTSYVYKRTVCRPSATVTINGHNLVKNRDYTIAYTNETNVGTATAIITGINGFTGENTKDYTIAKADINKTTEARYLAAAYPYTGKAVKPSFKLVHNNAGYLTMNTDYTVTYSNNTNEGTAKRTIKGKGNYKGTKVLTFAITSKTASLKKATVSDIPDQSYTGNARKPAVTVIVNGYTLIKDTDYTVTYANNIAKGTATVKITGKGVYTGSITKTFVIK